MGRILSTRKRYEDIFYPGIFAARLNDWLRKLVARLDAKKRELRNRLGTHISGNLKIISGQFPDTSRISGQFPDMPRISGQFLVLADSGGCRRIPAEGKSHFPRVLSHFRNSGPAIPAHSGGFRLITRNRPEIKPEIQPETRNCPEIIF